jgi:hypothetical protein
VTSRAGAQNAARELPHPADPLAPHQRAPLEVIVETIVTLLEIIVTPSKDEVAPMVQGEPAHWPVVRKGLRHHCEKRPKQQNSGHIVNQGR